MHPPFWWPFWFVFYVSRVTAAVLYCANGTVTGSRSASYLTASDVVFLIFRAFTPGFWRTRRGSNRRFAPTRPGAHRPSTQKNEQRLIGFSVWRHVSILWSQCVIKFRNKKYIFKLLIFYKFNVTTISHKPQWQLRELIFSCNFKLAKEQNGVLANFVFLFLFFGMCYLYCVHATTSLKQTFSFELLAAFFGYFVSDFAFKRLCL